MSEYRCSVSEGKFAVVRDDELVELDTCGVFGANFFAGEGEVALTEEFDELSNLLKIDLLGDWIGLLNAELDVVSSAWHQELGDIN